MSDRSQIEWTDATWNPTTGCDRVSPGCDNCYALILARRLNSMGNPRYVRNGSPLTSGPGFGLTLHYDQVDLPLRWSRPRRIFVDSMSDLYHEDVPEDFVHKCFGVMVEAAQHVFQVLTKRPRRMAKLMPRIWEGLGLSRPAANVWLGVSVEDQKRADQRIPLLLKTPAAIRFLSVEPLLGPVDLDRYLGVEWMDSLDGYGKEMFSTLAGERLIDWMIVGGESGPSARPMHPDWVRRIRDQANAAEVPFFFKQWGEWAPGQSDEIRNRSSRVIGFDGRTPDPAVSSAFPKGGAILYRAGKKVAGRKLDGRTWDEMPQPERSCRVCGCTDLEGCIEGCWWIAEDLCSSCQFVESGSALGSPRCAR